MAMNEQGLRGLCRAYAEGEINRQEYIRKRAELLDALEKQKSPADPYIGMEGATDEDQVDTDAPRYHGQGQRQEHGQRQLGRRKKGRLLIGVGILTLLLLGAAFMLSRQYGEKAPAPSATVMAGRPGSISGGPAGDGPEGRLRSFAEKGDWSVAAVSNFQKTWDGLSPEEQKVFRSAPWFAILRTKMKAHLQALKQAAGDNTPEPAMTFLLNFAAHTGLFEDIHEKSD